MSVKIILFKNSQVEALQICCCFTICGVTHTKKHLDVKFTILFNVSFHKKKLFFLLFGLKPVYLFFHFVEVKNNSLLFVSVGTALLSSQTTKSCGS